MWGANNLMKSYSGGLNQIVSLVGSYSERRGRQAQEVLLGKSYSWSLTQGVLLRKSYSGSLPREVLLGKFDSGLPREVLLRRSDSGSLTQV